jgi:transposase
MGGVAVPKLLFARAPKDAVEEGKVRKLAGARHAPADWIRRATIITLSWERLRVPQIARKIGCSEKTVRYRLVRFNHEGLDGLGDRPGAGRKRRISEAERSQIIALARSQPAGRPVRDEHTGQLIAAQESGPGSWTLDTAPADNSIQAGQAACEYSWRIPPSRSRRRTFRSIIRFGSVIGSGTGRSGAAWFRAWWARCWL